MSNSLEQLGEALPPLPLPEGIATDYVDCSASCGLIWHILKAGIPGKPLILFCHGFPEIAYSWRKVIPKVAEAGYYCVAMDQRGYGRTRGWPRKQAFHEVDLNDYVFTNLVRDLVCLVYALGYSEVHSIIGHDFGGVSSAMAVLMRPDIFQSTVQMSHPHHRPPVPIAAGDKGKGDNNKVDIQAELAKLTPPRKHYQWYNSTAQAAADWDDPPQGLEAFLRGYFHLKSADWATNAPRPLEKWSAAELASLPEYYIMRAEHSMPAAVAANMESENAQLTERWLSPKDLQVYCAEWRRTGFQGALNWYRAQTAATPQSAHDLLLFAGRRIEVPCAFISGHQDWGNHQRPGALEGYMDPRTVKQGLYRGARFIDGAGHWVQQEQPEAVVKEILWFLGTLESSDE
ncbi:alpha/beta-hydrolase [Durotheca rogersii]|uniref:alpha/beta-hydrolase n=1 Tax=Durotheca rogersii TaxID=419775 RepID=UPI00221F8C06|nr:alpha/beta-hydrolase [Durotheca rogersii]KAI5860654.1 alpha/beta-hydrolase [Durotheca rogersii]